MISPCGPFSQKSGVVTTSTASMLFCRNAFANFCTTESMSFLSSALHAAEQQNISAASNLRLKEISFWFFSTGLNAARCGDHALHNVDRGVLLPGAGAQRTFDNYSGTPLYYSSGTGFARLASNPNEVNPFSRG